MTSPRPNDASLPFSFSSNLIGMPSESTGVPPVGNTTNPASPVPVVAPSVPIPENAVPAMLPLEPLATNGTPANLPSEASTAAAAKQQVAPVSSTNNSISDARRAISNAGATSTSPTAVGIAQTQLPLVETSRVWGLDFARLNMQEVIDYADDIIQARECQYFITANLNYVMLSHEVPELQQVNANAAAVIADGNPIVIRSQFMNEPLPERVAGSDMIVELAYLAEERGYRMFFLGAAPGVAAKAAEKLKEYCPKLEIAGCISPPFRELTEQEHEDLLCQIRATRPDILFVAFGQPKGEKWIHENYAKLGVPLSIQLGASFDFLAGTAKRAPRMWQAIGCEWLYRSLCEPKRLAPRYAKNIWFLASRVTKDIFSLLR